MLNQKIRLAMVCVLSLAVTSASIADVVDICPDETSRTNVYTALISLLSEDQSQDNGGFGLHMWGAVVNRDGVVCAIANSDADRAEQ